MSESHTRKVVISVEHGGFGLSWAGMQRLAERKGLIASYFSLSPDIHRQVYGDVAINPDDTFTHIVIGPTKISAYPEGEGRERFLDAREIARDDADLVATVEELGADVASSKLAHLRVVEIPADVEWQIEEYDGKEWISERHRTWN